MQLHDLARYGLWCGVSLTAAANQRLYGMRTTWLPHVAMNTISLLLPDVCRLLAGAPSQALPTTKRQIVGATLARLIQDNPGYVLYVTPLAVGYLLSAPWLNIYKGKLGEKQLAGFGLDALPHALTALALTALVHDTAGQFAELAAGSPELEPLASWSNRHRASLSALILALATLVWEYGEYAIHRHELSRRGSDKRINMQWSRDDMLSDCAANAIGWAIATIWRHHR